MNLVEAEVAAAPGFLARLWMTWKYVVILGLLLLASMGLNLHLGKKLAAAGEHCRADMEQAARIAIDNERKRAASADRQAGKIAQQSKSEAHGAVSDAQGATNEREASLRGVVVHGDCRMPDRLPRLDPAVAAANAAAGD